MPGFPGNRFFLVLAPLAAIALALLVLVAASLDILSAGRAYVGGEGLWSKAQKDAVYYLLRYARSHDESDYVRFVNAIAVPLGDRKAREALDRPEPDYEAARQGFVEGRNHAEDVDAMARLFVRFRNLAPIAKAIDIWAQGDRHIGELRAVASELHGEIALGPRDPARVDALLARVHAINEQLTPLEDEFSYTLGEATRWTRRNLLWAMSAATLILVVAAAFVTRALLVRADEAERRLRESEERLRLVANSVPALISYVDRDERFRFSNRTYDRWFGIAHQGMVGRTVREIFGDAAYQEMRPNIARVLAGAEVAFEQTFAQAEGRRTLNVSYVPRLDREGEVEGFYVLASDVTALKRAQSDLELAAAELERNAARLEFLAHHDTLTGLPNRTLFQERASQMISLARRSGRQAALLYVDLDRFKDVNDSLGHGTGDALLQAVTERLRECVRREDLVARVGGDEFCVLLQEIEGPRDAGSAAQKLLGELSRVYPVAGHDLCIAASIGIACVPQDGDDLETLLRHADAAMYRAKTGGRGAFRFFSVGAERAAPGATSLLGELRQAVARGQLLLHYQPRADLATGRVLGYEALLRWTHPARGMVLPEAFIPIAEDTGLIVPIGEWALREACAQARRWQDAGRGELVVAVNLSMRQLRSADVVAHVRTALADSRLPAPCLELEITETVAMHAPERVQQTLRGLADLGVRLSLDDFGTGYSPLGQLKHFPLHAVKIDRSFVEGLPADPHDAAITQAIIGVAKSLGLETVAEGVATPAQREFLRAAGCAQGQGDLFGAPVPAARISLRAVG
jgi:diguanylate cyclase (GGDEF)-like protein/PAS domain S-box-containing protein